MPLRRLALSALLACLLVRMAPADDPPKPPESKPSGEKKEDKKEVSERVPTDEEARTLLEALQAAVKKKKAAEILRSTENFDGLVHKEFLKPFVKLLSFDDTDVSLRAAAILEKQKPRGTDEKAVAKEVDKAAADLWKTGWASPANEKRPRVRAAVARVLGAWGVLLDDRQYNDLERLWRKFDDDPQPLQADALVSMVLYAERAKDKRMCRHLAEWLDEPGSTEVNATTPPAEWFERKWKVWDAAKSAVRSALKTLTGQDFKSMSEAKSWFEHNEKTFGFKW